MMRLLQHPEQYLYEGTYQQAKGIKVPHAEALSKCFVLAGLGQSGIAYVNTREYEYATGIMRRFRQLWLARDSLEELERHNPRMDTKEGYEWSQLKMVRAEYHFDCFIIFTKSSFDFTAHLINRILKLGYEGKYVDLARRQFRAKISQECPTLGVTIERYSPWIIEVTKYRKAIEHEKAISPSYFNPDELRRTNYGLYRPTHNKPVLRFPEKPITFWESLFQGKKRTYRTRPVLPYCDSSIRKTREIVEKTFGIACEVLENSKAVREFRQAREAAIRSAYESIEREKLESLGQFSEDSIRQYLNWKFPKRGVGLTYASTGVSDMLKELQDSDKRTYGELDRVIDDHMEWFLEYERLHPPFRPLPWGKPEELSRIRGPSVFGPVGILRTIVKEIMREKTMPRRKH